MSDRWLQRSAWTTASLAIVLLVVSAVMLVLARDTPNNYFGSGNIFSNIVALGGPVLGMLIVAKHSRNRIGWLFIAYGLLTGLRSLGHAIYFSHAAQPTGYSALEYFFLWATEPANLATIVCLILLMLWFPDGQLPSRRWRFLYIWFFLAFAVLFSSNFVPGPNWNGGAEAGGIVIDNPYGWLSANLANTLFGRLGFPSFISLLLILFLSAISLIFRYRSAGQRVRLQLRWFVVGGFFTFILFLLPVIPEVAQIQGYKTFKYLLALLGQAYIIPLYLAVGAAIFYHRLYDINVIIRRSLQYGVLTAILALIYFGLIIFLQTLFGRATGEQSPVIIVISTLLIAALFTPLRRRVQDVIDRRFFRKKYDAQKVLAQFAVTARDETNLDELTWALQRVVEETMQPEGVRVWLMDTVLTQGRR